MCKNQTPGCRCDTCMSHRFLIAVKRNDFLQWSIATKTLDWASCSLALSWAQELCNLPDGPPTRNWTAFLGVRGSRMIIVTRIVSCLRVRGTLCHHAIMSPARSPAFPDRVLGVRVCYCWLREIGCGPLPRRARPTAPFQDRSGVTDITMPRVLKQLRALWFLHRFNGFTWLTASQR